MAGEADFWEELAGRMAHAEFSSPGELAKSLNPATRQTPALELIDRKLIDVAEGRCHRLMVFMPPQEGKSERTSHYFTLWMLLRNPDLRIAVASYDLSMAERWGKAVRNDIQNFSGGEGQLDLGLRLEKGSRGSRNWRLDQSLGGMFCCGVNGAITGKPVDLLLIDDPIKSMRDADSKTLRDIAWQFWEGSATTRLAPNAPVIVIQTRWHEDDLSGRLLAQAADDPALPQWTVVSIPAQAERDDPLGRQPGEWMRSARTGRNDPSAPNSWEKVKAGKSSRYWAAMYQQRPAPDEGGIFKRDWWRYYQTRRWMVLDDGRHRATGGGRVVMSWDMAFKDTVGADYVVGQVWQHKGAECWLLDQVRIKADFTETVRAFRALSAKWPQARAKYVEDKANGPAVIAALRQEIPGIIAISPKDSKTARASAVAPYVEAGNVWVPDRNVCPWVTDFIEELSVFPNGAYDDQVDACTQFLNRTVLGYDPARNFMDQLLREREGVADGQVA